MQIDSTISKKSCVQYIELYKLPNIPIQVNIIFNHKLLRKNLENKSLQCEKNIVGLCSNIICCPLSSNLCSRNIIRGLCNICSALTQVETFELIMYRRCVNFCYISGIKFMYKILQQLICRHNISTMLYIQGSNLTRDLY